MSMMALNSRIEEGGGGGSGFNGGCISRPLDEQFPMSNLESTSRSTSSSSIGKNSDLSSEEGDDGGEREQEVQSSYKGPLDSLDALEEVLPIRRGISKFYNGKSKSFTSLSDISSSKELAKPENSYSKKRKNLLAMSIILDKNRNNPLTSNIDGISKRLTSSKRSTLTLGGAVCSSESNNTSENSNSSSSPPRLPPLHPQRKPLLTCTSPRRSFSLADLQFAAARDNNTTSTLSNIDEHEDDPH